MSEPTSPGGRALVAWAEGDSRPLDEYGFGTVREAVLAIEGKPVPGFAWADLERRTFVALNRAGDAYHFVHPVEAQDRRVVNGLVTAGMLVCECQGGRMRGNCYQVVKAESRLREAGKSAAPDWIGPASTCSGYPEDSPQYPAPLDTPMGLEDDLAGAEADV